MNVLSALSIIIFTSFFIGAWNVMTAERKSVLNISACAVLLSLGWWSFCNAFFFAAVTREEAWFWHKLGAIGWCSFAALTAYYFFALINSDKRTIAWWKKLLFFLPAIVLMVKNLLGETTSLAENLIQSINGWGWTYVNSLDSFWLWAFLIYVMLYFGVALHFLYKWSKASNHKMKKEMAIGLIVIDIITISFGVITDVILPLTYPIVPALASVGTAFFGLGYFLIIYRHDVFNINLLISSDDILQISNNSIFVMDENREILKCNNAVESLLGYNKNELIGVDFMSLAVEKMAFNQLYFDGNLINDEAKLRCKNGAVKDVLVSASIAKDKHHSFLCVIISCQDVSKQKKIQGELEIEREKYKKLADDYQKLADYDPLTNLPNRRRFFDVLKDFEKCYREEKMDFAVIFMDLDNFKHTNDIYGHEGGDEFLKATANKLKSCTENDEFVARIGGDEFLIIMPYTGAECVENKLQRISAEFHRKIMFDGNLCEISISAGYDVFSRSEDTTQLMQKADEGMYLNKHKTSQEN
ncbi:MAG: diguanylate cyclase [Clostridia bacterium]